VCVVVVVVEAGGVIGAGMGVGAVVVVVCSVVVTGGSPPHAETRPAPARTHAVKPMRRNERFDVIMNFLSDWSMIAIDCLQPR
jgi:hypothetical protein